MDRITVYCDDESHAPRSAVLGTLEQVELLGEGNPGKEWHASWGAVNLIAPDAPKRERDRRRRRHLALRSPNGDDTSWIEYVCPLCGLHLRARSEKLTPIMDQLIAASALPDGRVSLKFLTLCYTR